MADRQDDGQSPDSGVDDGGNDAFASAFEAFAAGQTPDGGDPAPKDGDEDEGSEAGQDGAERGSNGPPSNGDDTDPPADASGAPPAAGEEAPDPWANASPAQIAARDKMTEELNRLRASDEGSRRRASGLQRQLNELRQTSAAQPPTNDTGGQGDKPNAGREALDEKIAQLERDYPEVAGPLIEMLKLQQAQFDSLSATVAPVAQANEAEAIAAQIATLEGTHKDWRHFGIADTPEYVGWLQTQPEAVQQENRDFRGWLSGQPPRVQLLADSEDAREVAVALTLFKTERAEAVRSAGGGNNPGTDATDARRRKQLDAGKAVGSRPGSAASGAPNDFAGAFEHFARKRERA